VGKTLDFAPKKPLPLSGLPLSCSVAVWTQWVNGFDRFQEKKIENYIFSAPKKIFYKMC
jgi:hypothetical protein